MLYDAKSKTLTEVVTSGLTDEKLSYLAAISVGKAQRKEGPVERVVLVFLQGPAEANRHLEAIQRFGIECRAFVNGEERVLVPGRAVHAGTLLPVLREESWPGVGRLVHRRLIPGPVAAGPWLTFALERGSELVLVQPDTLPASIAELEQRTLSNLAQREFPLERLSGGQVSLSEKFGSEAILLPEVMRRVQQMLSSPLVALGVPAAGGFIAVNPRNAAHVLGLVAWARQTFQEAKERRISPVPLLAQYGEITGFIEGARA